MDTQQFRRDLEAIDWGDLEGAYGPSDGSNRTNTDVPAALSFLAELDPDWNPKNEVTRERRAEALNTLHGHALRQGTLYEVTPYIVPFVMGLVSRHSADGRSDLADEPPIEDDLAVMAPTLAEAAFRYRHCEDAEDRRLGERVDAALGEKADRVLGWFDDLRAAAILTALYSEPLRDAGLGRVRELEGLPYYAYAAMAEIGDPPDWMVDRAESDLEAPDRKDRLAAAALIACTGDVPDRLKADLDEILRPGADAILNRSLECSILLDIPDVHPEFDGPLHEASVLVTRPERLVVQIPDIGNVSTRWCGPEIDKGDTIHVGLSPHENIRVVEWTDGEGNDRRETLEGR